MSLFYLRAISVATVTRPLIATAVIGAMLTAGPHMPARAQGGTDLPDQEGRGKGMPMHHTQAASRGETVEQRIAALHTGLKITPAEETDWQAVAQTMRDNAAAMQKLATEKASQSRQGMTALDDLQTYAQFAQAHVDGLKNLIASFRTLYNSMPDPQKKIADEVFQNSRRHGAPGPS